MPCQRRAFKQGCGEGGKTPARGLETAVTVAQLWPERADLRVGVQVRHHLRQRVAYHFSIGVEEEHLTSPRDRQALVVATREADILYVSD